MNRNVDLYAKGFPSVWHVCFYSAPECRWWWEWRLPAGFGHVMAFGYSVYSDRWLIYEVTHARTLMLALHPADFVDWLAGLPDNKTILRVGVATKPEAPHLRVGFWCTRAVAHLLGFRSRALRPVALYRELLARGAVPAFESAR